MGPRNFGTAILYAAALAATLVAVLLRLFLNEWLGPALPFVTLFGAVAISVWYGGLGPGIVSALVGWLACSYLFMTPRGIADYAEPAALIGLLAFVASSGVIIGFGNALRRGQRQARAGLEFLRMTFESIGDAVLATDAGGRVTYLNSHAEHLTGWKLDDARGREMHEVFKIINEFTRQPVASPVADVLRAGKPIGLANHTILVDRNGTERVIDDSAAPIIGGDGRIEGVILIFRDNTQRREAEKRLERSERELKDFFENASIGLHWVGPDGTILRANRAELDMLGYEPEEYVGKKIADFHVDRALIEEVLRRLSNREPVVDQEAQMRCKDGTTRTVVISSNVLWDGDTFVHTRCFTKDVTAQRVAETAGRRLIALVESSQDAIVAKDLNGIVTDWNDGAEQMFGYTRDEMVGQSILKLIPRERAHEETFFLERIGRGERIAAFQSIRRRKNGSLVPVLLTISPIHDVHGRVVGASKIARDISELKAIEQELRDADRRKDEFLATLAHELRNPLAPVRNAVEALKRNSDLPADAAWCREVIDRQARVMSRLIDDLLDVSRISRNRLELRREITTIQAVLDSAIETSRPQIDDGRHSLQLRIPDEPIYLDADPVRLAQVFANIINNAAKFSPPNGVVKITVERAAGNEIRVGVADEGVGIDVAMLPRIFDLFAQAPTTEGGGLGIGLALAKNLVELHGGRIEAHSDGPNTGTELTVHLRAVDASQRRARSDAPPLAAHSSEARRVLIVDDHRDNADALAMVLRITGHDVRVGYSGVDGLRLADEFQPHLILLDLGMPDVSGVDVCRAIRARPWPRDMVIVAVTGWGQDHDRSRTLTAGFDAHLVKPIDLTQLEPWLGSVTPRTAITS